MWIRMFLVLVALGVLVACGEPQPGGLAGQGCYSGNCNPACPSTTPSGEMCEYVE